jgi:diguanylate cyclase (GGDEF)-like protein
MRTITDQDGLTRLLNRASLMRQLDGFFSRASRYGEIVSLAMLDIDHFKEINDTHGHQAGDWVLRDLARFLQEELRDSDLIGRYGGEEFLIVLPRLPSEEAHHVIDRIREEYQKKEQRLPGGELITITFSGGIASFPEQGTTRDDVIGSSDAALYEAKRAGRNQIIAAGHANSS